MADETAPNPATPPVVIPTKQAPQPKGSKFPMKLVIVVLAVVLVGGGVGGFFLLRPKSGPPKEGAGAATEKAPAALLNLEAFTVNLNDPSGERYIKVTLRLTVSPAELAEKADKDGLLMARVRDRILTLLTSKTVQEVGSPLGKESLRREIQARLNPLFEGGKVEDVLFSDFVVQ
jgi:flagellar FliL protein